MPRKTPPLQIAEIGGKHHPNMEAAQQTALPILAGWMVSTLRDLLAAGVLTLEDGRITRPEKSEKGESPP